MPQGLYGANQIIAVTDSGLDRGKYDPNLMHDDFEDGNGNLRIHPTPGPGIPAGGIKDWVGDGAQDNHGHGTHVAGSILGNGIKSGSDPANHNYPDTCFAGMAPEAKLFFQAVGDNAGGLTGIPADLNLLFKEAYRCDARLHNNSWGSIIFPPGSYTTMSQDVDEFSWSHPDYTIFFAAGNDGVDFDRDGVVDNYKLSSPAAAKNCIAVGASENYCHDINAFLKFITCIFSSISPRFKRMHKKML